jgi:hypothetical protein
MLPADLKSACHGVVPQGRRRVAKNILCVLCGLLPLGIPKGAVNLFSKKFKKIQKFSKISNRFSVFCPLSVRFFDAIRPLFVSFACPLLSFSIRYPLSMFLFRTPALFFVNTNAEPVPN